MTTLASPQITRRTLLAAGAAVPLCGILTRRAYSDRPPRSEYVLTRKGLEFCDVLLAINAWGDRWTAGPEGPPVRHRHRTCGRLTHVEMRCAACGEPVSAADITVEEGPGARHRPGDAPPGAGDV